MYLKNIYFSLLTIKNLLFSANTMEQTVHR